MKVKEEVVMLGDDDAGVEEDEKGNGDKVIKQ